MDEENKEVQDSSTPEDESDIKTEDAEVVDKQKELADNYKIRAEKAESKLKQLKKEPKKEVKEEKVITENLSQKDMYVLHQANVHPDDLDEVTDYAKYKGITASEALETNHIKFFLQEKDEERKTAETTETKGGQRGAIKQSDESVISRARQGKDIAPEKAAEARMAIKLKEQKERNS